MKKNLFKLYSVLKNNNLMAEANQLKFLLKKIAKDPASEQADFYQRYINLGINSPFYKNSEEYFVDDSYGKNYELSFKLNDKGEVIPDSYQVVLTSKKPEDNDLTSRHLDSLKEIATSINWPEQYPGIVEYGKQFASLKLGPFEWMGDLSYDTGDIDFDDLDI